MAKTIGVVLLSKDSYYLKHDGSLPDRPSYDKELLIHLCEDKRLLCSPNTLKSLPKSLLEVSKGVTINVTDDWEVNLGISTFKDAMPDTMYIVRSDKDALSGKKFRTSCLDGHYLITEGLVGLEIWSKK